MSRNLALISGPHEFPLVQTPTELTYGAIASGSIAGALDAYARHLRSSGWGGFSWMDDHAPGWSWDPVTRHMAMIDAFFAFAPDARLAWT